MMLRQMVLDNTLPPYDRTTSGYYQGGHWPPSGLLVFNYGSWLDRYIEERYGSGKLAQIERINAGKPLNLLALFSGYGADFDRVLQKALGVSRSKLYQDFKDWLRTRFTKQIQAITAQGLTPAIRVSPLGFVSNQPSWSPAPAQSGSASAQSWIAYHHSDSFVRG